ncbi:MAG TPA: hypothetical protein P5228_09110 [Bacteroidales bacterium]|nr:hypothetical protein [Bacteroidales bacterium]HRZ49848.1 hypothetical protein [Bacteroidales bacterium]
MISRYFVTLDGPAHLYNARVILEIILGKNSEIPALFTINPLPVPNWSGHFLMVLGSAILPAWLSEKVVLLAYFILTPLFFRKLVLHLYPQNQLLTYPIILFTHNHLFYFGSFNMAIGIMLMFLTGFVFVRYLNRLNIKNALILGVLLLSVYFSHAMILMITIGFIAALALITTPRKYESGSVTFTAPNSMIRRLILIALAALPSMILLVLFFGSVDTLEPATRPDLPMLFQWIVDVRPLLALAYNDRWTFWTNLLFGSFMLIIISNLILVIRHHVVWADGKIKLTTPVNLSWVWFLCWFIFLFLFLIVHNSIVLIDRLIIVFFLFFILWLASLRTHRVIRIAALLIVVVVHLVFTSLYWKTMPVLSKDAIAMEKASAHIPDNSLVLTLSESDNWLHQRITGYLGADRPIAVIENYEAGLEWFPVKWNQKVYDLNFLAHYGVNNIDVAGWTYINKEDSTCFSLKNIRNELKPIPWVLTMHDLSSPSVLKDSVLQNMLNHHYEKVYSEGFCNLYQLKD